MHKCSDCQLPILLSVYQCTNCKKILCFRHFRNPEDKHLGITVGAIPLCEVCNNAANILKKINEG